MGLLLPNGMAKVIADGVNLGEGAATSRGADENMPLGGVVVRGMTRKWTATAILGGSCDVLQ